MEAAGQQWLAFGLVLGFALGAMTVWLTVWLLMERFDLPRRNLLDLVRTQAEHAGREAAIASLPERATHQLKVPFDDRPTLTSGEIGASPGRAPREWRVTQPSNQVAPSRRTRKEDGSG